MMHITYGEGGYDPSKPNSNIASVEEIDAPPVEPSTQDRLDAITDAVEALAFDLLMQQMGGQ